MPAIEQTMSNVRLQKRETGDIRLLVNTPPLSELRCSLHVLVELLDRFID